MYENVLAVLMVIALGLILGSAVGLIPGYILHRQGNSWLEMPARDRWFNIGCVAVCTIVAMAIIGWYSLLR